VSSRDRLGYSTDTERVIHFLHFMKRTYNDLSHVPVFIKKQIVFYLSLAFRDTHFGIKQKLQSECCFGSLVRTIFVG
jgi:hypothetical protein